MDEQLNRSAAGRFERLTAGIEHMRRSAAERREHSQILSDPRLAAEHHAALRAADGQVCTFCR